MEIIVVEQSQDVSNEEIEDAAEKIFQIFKEKYNPQDTASILTIIQYKVLINSFTPDQKEQAIEAINEEAKMLIEFLNKDWPNINALQ